MICSQLMFKSVAMLGVFMLGVFMFATMPNAHADWPQWRGPTGTGVADTGAAPPLHWNDSENVRWKTPLPGRGHSTPIVWGDTVFITTAVPTGAELPAKMSGRPGEHDNLPITRAQQFVVLAINKTDGSILWQVIVHEALPHEGGHQTASLASASPVTDGQHVFAYFGSYGLYCLDFKGKLVWIKSFPLMHSKHGHGEGASPAIHGDILIVNWDHEEDSFLLALNKTTGQELWRRPRDELTSWSTPLIVDVEQQQQVIVCGTERVRGYDLQTGDVVWECGGMSSNIVATPVAGNGVVYVGSSYEKRALMAIRYTDAKGDITSSEHVLWVRSRGTPYVPSPLLYDDALYFLTHYQNVITRIEAVSGQDSPGAIRLGQIGNIYASPVGAGGYVFITDLHGATQVISNAAIPREVSVNRIGEPVCASIAIAGRDLFLRGEKNLFCIRDANR